MALKWFQQQSQQACVVGLDGVPASMISRFMETGVMPRMKEIVARGRMTDMTVSLPEISSVSWTTFMTGRNPGEHGIFGFTDLHEGTYKTSFPSFREVRTDTIWDRIGEAKMRSVVINQPATYPARPVHGALVSGFVSVHLDRSVFPAKYLSDLQEMEYRVDLNAHEVRDKPKELFRELHALLDIRRKLVEMLWKEEKWNLMEVVVTGTDRLHHFLWDAYEDENHPHHGDFLDYYRDVDAFVGEMHDRFSATKHGNNFFVLSDHGFCGTKKEVNINSVLASHDYLVLSDESADSLESISERARAFCLDPARIYIHRRGRYPRGSVADGDVAGIKRELAEIFTALEDADGNPVIRYVFDGDDVYSGAEASKGPDLCLVPHNGYDLKGRVGSPDMFSDRRLQGMHTWDDAFFVTLRPDLMPEAHAGKKFTLVEIPDQILKSLDVQ